MTKEQTTRGLQAARARRDCKRYRRQSACTRYHGILRQMSQLAKQAQGLHAKRLALMKAECDRTRSLQLCRAHLRQVLRDNMTSHLRQNSKYYIPKHLSRLRSYLRRGDFPAYMDYAARKYRRGFQCFEHGLRHGCNLHCDQKHNRWDNRGLRPGCKAVCHTRHKWLPRRAGIALRRPFYAYIEANRIAFRRFGQPLTSKEKEFLYGHFRRELVDRVRVLELPGMTGFFNHKAQATTYGYFVIVKKGTRSNRLLKHELVHVCQYERYGIRGFAHRYADQYANANFSERDILFEKRAYEFMPKSGPVSRFLGYCGRPPKRTRR